MTRLRAVLALLLALSMVPIAAGPVAGYAYRPGWHFSPDLAIWVDDDCDSGDSWQITLWTEANPVAGGVKVCSWQSNFLNVPVGPSGYNPGNANDQISYVQITRWNITNPACKAYFFAYINYQPTTGNNAIWWARYVGGYSLPFSFNDIFSSFKVAC